MDSKTATERECAYCADKLNNKPIFDGGACKASVYFDGFDWVLELTARQEDRWYGDITEDAEVNFCPMCGRDLREGTAMTDNRTTELLRKLLDERGVEWRGQDSKFRQVTYWKAANGEIASYVESGNNRLVMNCTPDQAIAATLGDSELESYGQVPEQGKRDDVGVRESCGEVCGDDRFELIGKAKAKLLEATNIEMRPDEMVVIDSILFRCWQMGWLDKLRDGDSRYSDLFGTSERAARTLAINCYGAPSDACDTCVNADCDGTLRNKPVLSAVHDALLEWLRGDAENEA